jgi:citronellol/citronellal dehydrogenase
MSLAGKRVFITGGSRGIGLEIPNDLQKMALRSRLQLRQAKRIRSCPAPFTQRRLRSRRQVGALPLLTDIRDETAIESSVAAAVAQFGGLDILINNASAINLTKTEATPAKRFDLMFDVNVRGAFLTSQAAIPYWRTE